MVGAAARRELYSPIETRGARQGVLGFDPETRVPVPRWRLRPGGDFAETEALDDGELHAQRVSPARWSSTCATKGVLPGAPRPRLPPTEIGVIELDAERVLAIAHHIRHAAEMTAEMPFLSWVMIAWNHRVSGGVEDGACYRWTAGHGQVRGAIAIDALVFGSIEREEFVEADSFLKLHGGCGPCKFPFLSLVYMAIFYTK